jgi:hypothetical protein
MSNGLLEGVNVWSSGKRWYNIRIMLGEGDL